MIRIDVGHNECHYCHKEIQAKELRFDCKVNEGEGVQEHTAHRDCAINEATKQYDNGEIPACALCRRDITHLVPRSVQWTEFFANRPTALFLSIGIPFLFFTKGNPLWGYLAATSLLAMTEWALQTPRTTDFTLASLVPIVAVSLGATVKPFNTWLISAVQTGNNQILQDILIPPFLLEAAFLIMASATDFVAKRRGANRMAAGLTTAGLLSASAWHNESGGPLALTILAISALSSYFLSHASASH